MEMLLEREKRSLRISSYRRLNMPSIKIKEWVAVSGYINLEEGDNGDLLFNGYIFSVMQE